MVHTITISEEDYHVIRDGRKAFIVINDNESIKLWDTLEMKAQLYNSDGPVSIKKSISNISRSEEEAGLKEGYLILGLRDIIRKFVNVEIKMHKKMSDEELKTFIDEYLCDIEVIQLGNNEVSFRYEISLIDDIEEVEILMYYLLDDGELGDYKYTTTRYNITKGENVNNLMEER